jgi:trimethylamine---corrinoid protein Co-methyltransferase
VVDAQSGHEKTLTGLLPALAGANLIYGAGMLESGMTIDYAQLVMDAEFARLIKYCVNGVPVNDETLSVDVIHDIGPFSDFLSHEDTYRRMREQSQPRLIDRRVREEWSAAGSLTLYDRARAEAVRILEEHEPTPLPAGAAAEMAAIIAEAEAELGARPSRTVALQAEPA